MNLIFYLYTHSYPIKYRHITFLIIFTIKRLKLAMILLQQDIHEIIPSNNRIYN